jgi:hypothetical protein
MVALAVALYVLALARDTSCATSDGLLVAVGTLGGFIAVAAALYLRFRRTRSRFTAIAVSVALALIPTIIVGGTASGLETDYCCSASGCR